MAAASGSLAVGEDIIVKPVDIPVVVKRKRGRPPKNPVAKAAAASENAGDTVCFICLREGSLVGCGRSNCPKVYHLSCIKRDEAYFQGSCKWTCGWHVCNSCERSATYLCCTCVYSLCKGCVKGSDFVTIKGNMGLCSDCLMTVMLIEQDVHENKKPLVDCDDETWWKDSFGVYWFDVKRKLSLSTEEIIQANGIVNRPSVLAHMKESYDGQCVANDEEHISLESSSKDLERIILWKQTVEPNPRVAPDQERSMKKAATKEASVPEDSDWASKELLDFMAYMKNGDKSVFSQLDVTALLLEYIERNNLHDPLKNGYIICDQRLQILFGKESIDHLEMVKLLKSHFSIKEPACAIRSNHQSRGLYLDPVETEGYNDVATMLVSNKRDISRKSVVGGESERILDDFAAIDVHNISLLYLQRNMMENLLSDEDKFHELVVGSFVRIRISNANQRPDMYRLVQVIGTQKVVGHYVVGKRTTDIRLQILNLDKKELITIDSTSNQEFTEDECSRLRTIIKLGFIDHLKVGQVREKARVLHTMRVNEWFNNQRLRLSHLRDRASEKGHMKDLRECVEKLELLMPEYGRRIDEVPEIHADPYMRPGYESLEEETTDPKQGKDGLNTINNMDFLDPTADTMPKGVFDRTNERSQQQNEKINKAKNLEAAKSQTSLSNVEAGIWGSQQLVGRHGPSYGEAMDVPNATCTRYRATSISSETEMVWNYEDPTGKIQGPFAMSKLRKWHRDGYFPPELRIWQTSEKKEHSVLLVAALRGKFPSNLFLQDPQDDMNRVRTYPAMHFAGEPYILQSANYNRSLGDNLSSPTNAFQTSNRGWVAANALESNTVTPPMSLDLITPLKPDAQDAHGLNALRINSNFVFETEMQEQSSAMVWRQERDNSRLKHFSSRREVQENHDQELQWNPSWSKPVKGKKIMIHSESTRNCERSCNSVVGSRMSAEVQNPKAAAEKSCDRNGSFGTVIEGNKHTFAPRPSNTDGETTALENVDAYTGLGPQEQGNKNLETGAMNAEGNANANSGWGAAEGSANRSSGLETWEERRSNATSGYERWEKRESNSNTIWTTHENPNEKEGWGTSKQGNSYAGCGAWEECFPNRKSTSSTPIQGNINANYGSGTAPQGNAAISSWEAAVQGNSHWGDPMVNTNRKSGCWPTPKTSANENDGWGSGHWNTQKDRYRDGFSVKRKRDANQTRRSSGRHKSKKGSSRHSSSLDRSGVGARSPRRRRSSRSRSRGLRSLSSGSSSRFPLRGSLSPRSVSRLSRRRLSSRSLSRSPRRRLSSESPSRSPRRASSGYLSRSPRRRLPFRSPLRLRRRALSSSSLSRSPSRGLSSISPTRKSQLKSPTTERHRQKAVCKYYAAGYCMRGESCKFIHL